MPLPGVPRRAHSYNFGAVQCVLGALTLSNFMDGGITVASSEGIVTSEKSADGIITYVYTSDERTQVTINLAATSASIPVLDALIRNQLIALAAGQTLVPIPLYLNDPSTGDLLTGGAICMNEGQPSMESGLGTRTYEFEVPYGRWRKVLGTNNPTAPLL